MIPVALGYLRNNELLFLFTVEDGRFNNPKFKEKVEQFIDDTIKKQYDDKPIDLPEDDITTPAIILVDSEYLQSKKDTTALHLVLDPENLTIDDEDLTDAIDAADESGDQDLAYFTKEIPDLSQDFEDSVDNTEIASYFRHLASINLKLVE